MHCFNTLEILGLIVIPQKSSTVMDLEYTLRLFFYIGTVNDCPNSLGIQPTNNIRLNNLAKIHGKLILIGYLCEYVHKIVSATVIC